MIKFSYMFAFTLSINLLSNNVFTGKAQIVKQHSNLPEESRMNFTELARKYGAKTEEYEVVTADGYIITLFHVLPMNIGLPRLPVFLMHGLADCADEFLLRGNTSLAITLSRRGYDVWAGNIRGVRYARKHLTLSDKDRRFWDYSLHENGYYDLPAQIDFVLKYTGYAQLNAIGHSQGNTIFYVLGSTRPEYNEKVNLMIALSPVAFLHNSGPFLKTLLDSALYLNDILIKLGIDEVIAEPLADIYGLFCAQKVVAYNLCVKGALFQFLGDDSAEIDEDFFLKTIGHYPQPVSRKALLHFYQIATSRRFARYNYGRQRNLQKYRSYEAPDYDLRKVVMKVALFYGKNDALSPVKNVARLKRLLPNVVDYWSVEWPKWNHVDWMWAKHLNKYFYPHLLQILDRYSSLDK